MIASTGPSTTPNHCGVRRGTPDLRNHLVGGAWCEIVGRHHPSVVVLVRAAVVVSALASAAAPASVAALASAFVAVLLAAALIPDRVGHHVQRLHRRHWVVAGDDQLARDGAFLSRFVADYEAEACARRNRCGERVVDQLP